MKKQLTAMVILALTFGTLQLPARADHNFSLFGRMDRDHDGRWNYRDFYDANRYYERHHPGVTVIRRDYRTDFGRLDRNHDGYVTREEVRRYRDW